MEILSQTIDTTGPMVFLNTVIKSATTKPTRVKMLKRTYPDEVMVETFTADALIPSPYRQMEWET